jgi:hypothetical protein
MFRGEIPVGGEVLRIERFFVRVRVPAMFPVNCRLAAFNVD